MVESTQTLEYLLICLIIAVSNGGSGWGGGKAFRSADENRDDGTEPLPWVWKFLLNAIPIALTANVIYYYPEEALSWRFGFLLYSVVVPPATQRVRGGLLGIVGPHLKI